MFIGTQLGTDGKIAMTNNAPLHFWTNNTERLRIDTAGDLLFKNATTSHQGIKFYKDAGLGCSFTYGENNANPTLNIYRSDSQSGFPYGNLIINTGHGTSPTQALKLRTDKHIELAGSLYMAAGQGISFINAADTATGETVSSSVLDDYEEGTFSVAIAGSSSNPSYTASHAAGTYTKIGNRVLWNLQIILTAVASQGSGNVQITGLPFSSAAGYSGVCTFNYNDTWSKNVRTGWASGTTVYPSPNQTNQHPCTWSSSAGEGNLQLSTGYFTAAGQYQV